MVEPSSTDESTKRWEFLQGIEKLKPRKSVTASGSSFNHASSIGISSDSDPFECCSIAILPSHDVVENTIHHHLEEWQKLDARKVRQRPTMPELSSSEPSGREAHEDENLPSTVTVTSVGTDTKDRCTTNYGGGWRAMDNRLLLPDGFDYNSGQQMTEKEEPADVGSFDEFVFSLKNPTQRLSYHGELSKLFCSIPTSRELEEQTRLGHSLENTMRMHQEARSSIKTNPDCHALARLRVPDRHGIPDSFRSFRHSKIKRSKRRQNQQSRPRKATITLEFWRRLPKRHATSGCHRMVVEFLASQTLWDVHLFLSEMAEDDLWMASHDDKYSTIDETDGKENVQTSNRSDKKEYNMSQQRDCQKSISGCFFIEKTFYETGSIKYAKPIIDWIDGSASVRSNSIRRVYLGVDSSRSMRHVKRMKGTKLSQVPFRLNIRYYHACHGDVETTVLLVDRKLDRQESENALYPLIHDVWTAPHVPAIPLCDACKIYQTIFKTATDCKITDGGPRSLCLECLRDLNIHKNDKESVKLYRQWQDQFLLSKSVTHE